MDEIRIGSHVLQPNRQLLVGGEHVHLGPRALSILTVLAEEKGEIVTKDELMEAVWGDVTVEENALQVHVTALRKALGADAELLRTLRGIGYQLNPGEGPPGYVDIEEGPGGGAQHIQLSAPKQWARSTVSPVATAFGLLLLVALISFAAFYPFADDQTKENAPTTLAVLPFQVSGDAEWQARGAALSGSLSSNLARVPNIEFVSSTATKAVFGQDWTASQLGTRLGVDHFIEGDVQAAGNRLTALVRLVDASTGRAIWSGEIQGDKKYPDEFEALLLNRISAILISLNKVANGEVEIPDDLDPRAYEAYLDGLASLSLRTWQDSAHALRQMQLAASIAPDFAEAHAGTAFVLGSGSNASFDTIPRDEYLALQAEASAKALELDPDNFMAELANAHVQLNAHGNIAVALEVAEELLERRPRDSHAHDLMSFALASAGRLTEAAAHRDQALAADPFNYQIAYYRRSQMAALGDYRGVKRSALKCRADCWYVANQWWGALLKIGNRNDYQTDIEMIANMYDDERAYYSGEAGRAQSIKSHAEFIFLDRPNPWMRNFPGSEDSGSNWGISDWTLLLFRYGYVDAAFNTIMRKIDVVPVGQLLTLFYAGRLMPSEEIRADPRYHAIFEIPRFKAVAEYRREQGMTAGLPVFPVKPYDQK